MKRREFTQAGFVVVASGPLAGWTLPAWALSETDAAAGVRAALERGAAAAVALLGKPDGFLANPLVKIQLPKALEKAGKLLKATGQGKQVDGLVTSMNRAAEQAVPESRALLQSAVKSMSVDDAVKIVRGSDTSVTEFFAGKTRTPLTEKFLPIVTRATERVKLAEQWNRLAERTAALNLLQGDEANAQRYVTVRSLDGLYKMIGEEERKLRADPGKAASAILKKVFGR
ncbi:MAG: DUF4197 domain-containing protein [Rubrivivax sp.]|jgi:hypothetical protein